jgi:hypothetical protein
MREGVGEVLRRVCDSEGMWDNRDRRGFGLRVIGGKIKRYLH